MKKIIDKIKQESFCGLVKTKKVIEIIANNYHTSKGGRYAMVFSGDLVFIGCVTKIDTVCKVLDILGKSYSVSEEHSHSWYEARKKEYRAGKLEGVHFL